MRPAIEHPWNVSIPEAIRIQEALRCKVVTRDDFAPIRTVAGMDIGTAGGRAKAAVVLLKFPELELLEQRTAERPIEFPYVPGFLAFREIPAILDALARLRGEPDLLVTDGQGRAHPRRFGLACHLGVLLDKPTIGCAKSLFCGEHDEPKSKAGSWTPLSDAGEVIGAAVRTKDSTRVVYVSVGHRVSLESAIQLVLRCCTKYRIPQPTRLADHAAAEEGHRGSK